MADQDAETYPFAQLLHAEGSAPATPSAGTVVTYAKTDGRMYSKDDAGAETLMSGGGLGVWTAYTPAWTSTGTAPTLGNGTIAGRRLLLGPNACLVEINFVFGSTSSAGTGAWNFSLPFTAAGGRNQFIAGSLVDAGTAHYVLVGRIDAGTGVIVGVCADATGTRLLSQTQPISLATGDEIAFQGVYEI